ncbi:hypothetical protein Moror_1176 [Moniliophthora roreri MCA 2997]|uniref:Rhodopsin domain-containing protein n=2 Tax=Moniliophthora roreri TaxID=221103 RepID=V2XCG6_MONRO|nr:hypothetical protein Moror_1176 [Moniliophthora roreri MCA 2997]KAI3618128.1 hypothetical protein WG66_005765 [Moniliophthora roreri]
MMISVMNLRIIITVLFGVAQLTTCARAGLRFKRHRFWVDDAIASFALVCSLVGLVCFWMNMAEGVEPLAQSEASRMRTSWIVNVMFLSVIWLSRLAILCSLIRVLPCNLRRLPYAAGSVFAMMWTAILVLTVKMCEPSTEWQKVNHQCKDHVTSKTALSFEFSSALFLIISPAVFSAKLPASTSVIQQGILVSIAVVGFFFLAGSISRGILLIQSNESLGRLTACVQVATALLFTNLPAFVVFACGSPGPDLDDPSHTGSALPLGRRKLSAESLKASIGFPRPLSARRSVLFSTSRASPNSLPYHVTFFPPASEEKRRQEALLLCFPVEPSGTCDESLTCRPRPIHSSDENATEVEHSPPLLGDRTVQFKHTPATPSLATVRSRDSMHNYFITREPSKHIEAKREGCLRSWISGDFTIHDGYNRSPASTPKALGSDRTTFAESQMPILSDVGAVRSLTPSVTDTYSPSASEVDLAMYSALISKYLVDSDPHSAHNMGTVAADGQPGGMPELVMPTPVWLPGPDPLRTSRVQPF